MQYTNVFRNNLRAYVNGTRIIANKGGTSSSKTFSILQLLMVVAAKHNKLISVVSETLPHLKRGAMRDFFTILDSEGAYHERYHNKSDNIYQMNDSKIEFFSADSPDRVRGPRRDILFVNECNNIPWSTIEQLMVRTNECIFFDWNPTDTFWYEEKILNREDQIHIHSTYMDALNILPAGIIKEIEARKPVYKGKELISGDENWWRVYGLGETGSIEGLVFNNWEIVDEMPDEYKCLGYGLDFGFTNDPTALVEMGQQGGVLWLDEKIYETGLTNDDIFIKAKKKKVDTSLDTIADSAEPKSIEELYRMGWNVKPVVKGKDSINSGIDLLKTYKLKVTKRSVGLIKELRNYKWAVDKYGKALNKPIDSFNHSIDAVRYMALMKLSVEKDRNKILHWEVL